ncbi:MAG: hypothetical protein QG552_1486 [Thermodesulfobacteriota bacterium]|nr:hypothetical protein [Thermodesulfobacteriota bacterium]
MLANMKKMVIIASYFKGETYGLLGPQMAATVIQENTSCDCIVIGVAREDDKALLKKAMNDYFGRHRPIIGFSSLGGRPDLIDLARELSTEGAFTLLAGPQADVDYKGEVQWDEWPHRFRGVSNAFPVALHGPAEQAIELLKDLERAGRGKIPGLLSQKGETDVSYYPRNPWDDRFLSRVNWGNIYRIENGGLRPHRIRTGQVLQQIGCPHASQEKWVEIDAPNNLTSRNRPPVRVRLKGCSFCDVAADKGFYGALGMGAVLNQIQCLPERPDGSKIPFELINENALVTLPRLIVETAQAGIGLSQINLTLRADWLLKGEGRLREALDLARTMRIRILLASVGFESFDDAILRNLNKGLCVETNLAAMGLMRRLKEEFPDEWGYARSDGANHGFIHPTPWDTEETWANIKDIIERHRLAADIIPDHSIPLIIHHASGLGDWIREVETREGIRYGRLGSIIEWWQEIGQGPG